MYFDWFLIVSDRSWLVLDPIYHIGRHRQTPDKNRVPAMSLGKSHQNKPGRRLCACWHIEIIYFRCNGSVSEVWSSWKSRFPCQNGPQKVKVADVARRGKSAPESEGECFAPCIKSHIHTHQHTHTLRNASGRWRIFQFSVFWYVLVAFGGRSVCFQNSWK